MNRQISLGVIALLLVALLLGVAWHNQRDLERDLPVPVKCADESDAWVKATAYVTEHGGSVIGTSGTPSMQPLIVGKAVLAWRKAKFADVERGAFIMYHPVENTSVFLQGLQVPAPPEMIFAHVAAARDSLGVIPSGLNNARSESWGRVTESNFVGIVDAVFVWNQP